MESEKSLNRKSIELDGKKEMEVAGLLMRVIDLISARSREGDSKLVDVFNLYAHFEAEMIGISEFVTTSTIDVRWSKGIIEILMNAKRSFIRVKMEEFLSDPVGKLRNLIVLRS